ncbi:MAG: hypothetical protein ACKN9T_15130 [Candidatus Methylumidiphilus sp.]
MRGRRGRNEDLNYWPSVADFMLALFMIALILGLTNIVLLFSNQESDRTKGEKINLCMKNEQDCQTKLLAKNQEICEAKLDGVIARVRQCQRQLQQVNDDVIACGKKLAACQKTSPPLPQPQSDDGVKSTLPDGVREDKQTLFVAATSIDSAAPPSEQAQAAVNALHLSRTVECEKKLQDASALATQCGTALDQANANQRQCLSDLEICRSQELSLAKDRNKPLILEITDADGLTFDANKADTNKFKLNIKSMFEDWKKKIKEHECVNTIEIIGHTDSDKISKPEEGQSVFDNLFKEVLSGTPISKDKLNTLKSSSNADLGLWRAVAMSQLWQEWVEKNTSDGVEKARLLGIKVRLYSAAFGIPNKESELAQTEKERKERNRRIEIRFTQLDYGQQQTSERCKFASDSPQ